MAAFAAPANFSGKWAIQSAGGRGGGGRGGPVILVINQVELLVTGAMTVRIDAEQRLHPVDVERFMNLGRWRVTFSLSTFGPKRGSTWARPPTRERSPNPEMKSPSR